MLAAFALALGLSLPPARFELLEGRAEVAREHGVVSLVAGGAALSLEGTIYVELPVRSRARVDWPGAASFELYGPATLEWSAVDAHPNGLRVRVFACTKLIFETRRAELQLECARGWRCELARGAGELVGVRGGAFELALAAGTPSYVSVQTGARITWPKRTVLPGARVLLIPGRRDPLPSAGSAHRVLDLHARDDARIWDDAPKASAWRGRSWPWSSEAEPAVALNNPTVSAQD